MSKKKNAFTLIELSISLIIIGLLIGGVLLSQGLVRQSKIRRVINDAGNYMNAINTFQLTYGMLPGDFSKATSYWPTAAGNGDGDGVIVWSAESYRAWNHLMLAGLISGSYNGTSQEPQSTYSLGTRKFYWRVEAQAAVIYGMRINFFSMLEITPNSGSFAPLDFYYIDKKIDDGIPSTGWVLGWSSAASPACIFGSDNVTGQSSTYASFPTSYSLSTTETCIRMGFLLDRVAS